MTNPIKHVRETGEYVSIKPKPAVMGYRQDDPIPSDNNTLLYWKRVYEERCREVARLDMEIEDLKWDITFLKDQLRQKGE
jgi:hypothetical protein